MVPEGNDELNINDILKLFIKKSSFTERQISIIYNMANRASRPKSISSGAYYRQAKQCRIKISSTIYSMILLQALGIIDMQALQAAGQIGEQISVILSVENSDISSKSSLEGVISVIDAAVKRMSKV